MRVAVGGERFVHGPQLSTNPVAAFGEENIYARSSERRMAAFAVASHFDRELCPSRADPRGRGGIGADGDSAECDRAGACCPCAQAARTGTGEGRAAERDDRLGAAD